jgi:hypothetical protein
VEILLRRSFRLCRSIRSPLMVDYTVEALSL